MAIQERPTFKVQPADTPVAQFAMRIVVEGAGLESAPIGTAAWLCSHLAVTARHNLEDVLRRYGPDRNSSAGIEIKDYAIRLYHVVPGPEYAVWEVVSAWTSAESDLALLHLALWGYSGLRPNPYVGLRLRALPPTVGSRVAGFGYHSMTAVTSSRKNNRYHLDLDGASQATTGVVRSVFEYGRDKGMYAFPCFEVNARFDSGMSGGPVFNEVGELVGVICGSLPAAEGKEDVSYVITLWPLLRILINASKAGGSPHSTYYPAIDLALEGILNVVDLSSLNPDWFPGRALPQPA